MRRIAVSPATLIAASSLVLLAGAARADTPNIEKCGHKPMFEHPAKYHEVLREFLRDKMGTS